LKNGNRKVRILSTGDGLVNINVLWKHHIMELVNCIAGGRDDIGDNVRTREGQE
jgi:hypothetical protein